MMHCQFVIRTSVKKLVDDAGIALGWGDAEDGPALDINSVNSAAPEEQERHNVGVAHGRGHPERRAARSVTVINICLCFKQQLADVTETSVS